jgi:hypothetical protein
MKEYQFKIGSYYLDVYAETLEDAIEYTNAEREEDMVFNISNRRTYEGGVFRAALILETVTKDHLVSIWNLETLSQETEDK